MKSYLWGPELRAYRLKHCIGQAELGDRLGVDTTTVSRWERELMVPNIKMQRKIRDLMRFERSDKNLKALLSSPIGCIEACSYEINKQTIVCLGASPQSVTLFHSGIKPFSGKRYPPETQGQLVAAMPEANDFWRGDIARIEGYYTKIGFSGASSQIKVSITPFHTSMGCVALIHFDRAETADELQACREFSVRFISFDELID